MLLALFDLAIFGIGPQVYVWAGLDLILLFILLLDGMTGMYHQAQLLVEMGFHELFAWGGLEPRSSQSLPPK
jgi:hypothetical protein